MEKLTLDTMLLQHYWKQRPRKDAIERLLELAREGRVDLAVTARVQQARSGGKLEAYLQA